MFCSPHDETQNANKSTTNRSIKKRKNKNKKKKKKINAHLQESLDNKGLFPDFSSMSVLTNFTAAATWQITHELNFWKARAKALEYENGLLRDIIKKKGNGEKPVESQDKSDLQYNQTVENKSTELDNIQEEDCEMDEEFLKFIEVGVKFRAERDRQRLLKAENAAKAKIPQNVSPEDVCRRQQEFYGEQWRKVSALELYLQSKFNSDIDRETPQYWPIVPLNLNSE